MKRLWLYCWAVFLSGLALWGWSCRYLSWHYPGWGSLMALAVTCVYAEVRSLDVPGYGVINFGEGIYFGATLSCGGPFSAPLTALLGLISDSAKKGKPAAIVLFNLGWSLITYTLVGWTTRGFQPDEGLTLGNTSALLLGTLTYAVTASLLQACCQTLRRGLPLRRTLRQNLQGMWVGAPAALILGVFGGILLDLAPWAILLALFPVEIFTAYVRVKELHQELLATQGQLQANSRQAALGVLTAGVAHEINNPLAAMATSIHLLERQTLPPQGQLCLKLLSQGVERCRSITDRMLLYSRPPENRPSDCKVGEVVQDALLFLGSRLGRCQVETTAQVKEAPPVACDPGVLVQVLTNLFSNAADAMPGGGRIQVSLASSSSQLRLLVSDSGTGIPARVQERMWEPFFTTKGVGQGTGLGLSISQSLIQAAGGQLTLLSSGAQGSVFQVGLPLR